MTAIHDTEVPTMTATLADLQPWQTDQDGLSCHCPADPDGHVPGNRDLGCSAELKAPRIRPFKAGPPERTPSARGTCPGCGKRMAVRAVRISGVLPETGKGPLLAIEPRVIEHKTKTGTCPGGIPTETRYSRPKGEVDAWVREHGPDSIRRTVRS